MPLVLKLDSSVRKMESDSSKTSGTDETPFLESATHRYCLMALMNISLVLKMGPVFCRMDSSSCSDRTFDLSSWDLWGVTGLERSKFNAEARHQDQHSRWRTHEA